MRGMTHIIAENKVWGQRWVLRRDSTHENSYLQLLGRTRCSWHVHQTKWNLFFLICGAVNILKDGETIHLREPGDTALVAPGEFHEFQVLEDSKIIEEMFVEYNPDDIARVKVGGPLEITA
jgi:mannose-6-phosphate isomerase-like protein (cupin superfamily)